VKPRIRRAARLVELAEKAENEARARAVAAEQAHRDARRDAEREEHAWTEAARDFTTGIKHVSELEAQAAYLETLRRRADAACKRVEKALEDERLCAAEVVRAATERRKLELWRDRIVDTANAEETRLERMASDALAARIASRGDET
jgi:hypothetical protein